MLLSMMNENLIVPAKQTFDDSNFKTQMNVITTTLKFGYFIWL